MEIKIGISPCPNDIYLYAGLILGKISLPQNTTVTFDFQDVQVLNENTLRGVYDFCKISAVHYFRVNTSYKVLPCGGAMGYGCGPLLLGHPQNNWNPNASTYIPGKYTTAAALLKFFSPQTPTEELRYDQILPKLKNVPHSQGVIIHESRFIYQEFQLKFIQDLGQYWEEKTHSPIPLGVLVGRKEHPLFPHISEAVRQSLEWSRSHHHEALELCAKTSQELDQSTLLKHIQLYVNDFSFDMGEEGRRALDLLGKYFPLPH